MRTALKLARASVPAIAIAAGMFILPAIATAQGQAAPGAVTFSKDVAPILQRSCQNCHRPDGLGPMSLVKYDEVRPWARSIKTRVANREMPPWHIDRNIGIQKFKNDPSLTDKEVDTIVKWVDAGAPQGNPADMPPARKFSEADEWVIGNGKPDLVLTYPKMKVPATGMDLFGSVYAKVPETADGDRYYYAIESRAVDAKSRRVIHHFLHNNVPAEQNTQFTADDGDLPAGAGGQFLQEYASGKGAELYPQNSGVILHQGYQMRGDFHLHPMGEEVEVQMQVALMLYPKGEVPKHVRWSMTMGHPMTDLDIPAGNVVRKDGYTRLAKAARITNYQAHMHSRGVYQCMELIYPTSGTPMKSEIANCVKFTNDWHLTYNYADETAPLVPAGTIVHIMSWYDNTPAKKGNMDPRNWTGSGGRTIDEMGFSWIGWYDLTDEEYKQELTARRALQRASPTNEGQQQQ